MSGKLYLVATPIGNLEDITLRAIRILSEVDLVAAEDTRNSGRLLKHLDIDKPLISYFEHNKKLREGYLIGLLQEGKNIALICDAGTPGLSDPGADITAAAISQGIEVYAVPGASALLTALTSSGLDNGSFCFEGFLPREKGPRRRALAKLADEKRVMVFYEAPHRLQACLEDMREAFGNDRQIAVCRELTKFYEEKIRGSLEDVISHFGHEEPRGEFCLVVAGTQEKPAETDWQLIAGELANLMKEGCSRKEASKKLAEKYGVKSKEVYSLNL